jgi:hypothetical protein
MFVFFAVGWSRRIKEVNQVVRRAYLHHPAPSGSKGGFHNPIFEQPTRWLAVRSQNIFLVQESLGIAQATPCSWEEGLLESREQKLFISPPINGWILVLGAGLPDTSDDVDKVYHFLVNLSRKLGQVQYFNANRVLNHHSWAILEQGEVFRAYAWGPETSWNQGRVTAAERDLKISCLDYGMEPSTLAARENLQSNAEKIYRLAARWSIDPTNISEEVWNARRGIVGRFSTH